MCKEDIICQVRSYLRYKHKQTLLILSRLCDLQISSEDFNIHSEGFISQLWNTVGDQI